MKWINTKVEFVWNSKKQKYVETDVHGYYYSGPIALCSGGAESFGSGEHVTEHIDLGHFMHKSIHHAREFYASLNKSPATKTYEKLVSSDSATAFQGELLVFSSFCGRSFSAQL